MDALRLLSLRNAGYAWTWRDLEDTPPGVVDALLLAHEAMTTEINRRRGEDPDA